jgi:hypothetical protein
MAVMARYLGIPARVNVGFTPGTLSSGGTRIISAHDAHAWPELWMPGVGWTRFEPTPGSAQSNPNVPNWLAPKPQDQPQGSSGDTQNGQDQQQPGQSGAAESPQPVPVAGADGQAADLPVPACVPPQVLDAATQECTDEQTSDPWWQRWWKQEAGAGLLLLLLLVPAGTRVLMRRRRWYLAGAGDPVAAAEWAWVELRDSAVDLGYLWPDARTPRQTSAELAADGKLNTAGADALAMITQFVERVRYAPDGGTGPGREHLHDAVDDVRRELGVSAGRQRRIRALTLPRSVGTMLGRVAMSTRTRSVAARHALLRSLRPRRT